MRPGCLWILVGFVLVSIICGLIYLDYNDYINTPISDEPAHKVKVVIPNGATFNEVLQRLEEKGVVTRPLLFKLYMVFNGYDAQIKAGTYYFSTDQTPAQIALRLTKGPAIPYSVVTIKEGYNIWQVANALEAAGICTKEEFFKLARDKKFAQKLGIRIPDGKHPLYYLEGFLFPETYFVAPDQPCKRVMKRMVILTLKKLRELKKKHLRQYAKLMEKYALTDWELVTLASLAERETPLPHEKRLIVSVLLNRLSNGMKLQVDPTLTYTEEKKGGIPQPSDRKNKKNPYNTYVYEGLPPGPICNPGESALEAAVAPAHTTFLYYVARRDGTGGHFFTDSYEEHKKAIRRFLRSKWNQQEKKDAKRTKLRSNSAR